MSDRRSAGVLLLVFTVLNLVAVALLSAAFGWPAVLDEPAAVALPAFSAARGAVIAGFLLQTALSVALVPIAISLHRVGEGADRIWPVSVTVSGMLAGLTQALGWIRWPITVPGLADTFADPTTTPDVRTATVAAYDLLNSYAGAAVGEYLGWLFQALWAVGVALLLVRAARIGRTTAVVGLVLTAVWALSFVVGPFAPALGAGVFATVAFAAYAGWFLWLGAVGVVLLRAGRRTMADAR